MLVPIGIVEIPAQNAEALYNQMHLTMRTVRISKKTRDLVAFIVGGSIVLLGTIILVAMATGWQYDLKTGELRETGLVLLGSEPAGATIFVNDKDIKHKTPYRFANVIPGTYQLRYEKSGYRVWRNRIDVEAELVSFADYAWLIPETIPSRPRYSDFSITAAVQSQDRRRFVFIEQSTGASAPNPQPRLLTSTDLTRPPVALYAPTVPAPGSTGTAARLLTGYDNLQLSPDSGELLLRMLYNTGEAEWMVLPAAPSDSPRIINLSTDLAIKPTWLSWGPSGSNELFYTEASSLRRIQLSDRRISDVLITNVVYAEWSANRLITVEATDVGKEYQLLIRDKGDLSRAETIGPVGTSTDYTAKYFKLLDQDYIVLLNGTTRQLSLTRGVYSNKNSRTTSIVGNDVTQFTVNGAGRYLVYNENNRFVSIDLELSRRARFGADITGLTQWEWINDQHLVITTSGKLRLLDFDGQNDELLSENVDPAAPILFSDNKSILNFTSSTSPDPAKPVAQRQFTHFFLLPDRIIE